MKNSLQVGLGILAALVSVGIILGSLSLSLAESGTLVALFPTRVAPTLLPTEKPVLPAKTPGAETPATRPVIKTATPTASPTVPPPTNCPPPGGWQPITLSADDTLLSLAQRYDISPDTLALANCLVTVSLLPGTILYVPPLPPTPTFTETPSAIPSSTATVCGPPAGWVWYTVQSGDSLGNLSRILGMSVADLQSANCMGSSRVIVPGQIIYVPHYLPRYTYPTAVYHPPVYFPTPTFYLPPPTAFLPTVANPPTELPPLPTETFGPPPTAVPTDLPTQVPTAWPTEAPTEGPPILPTVAPPEPQQIPTVAPTVPATEPPQAPTAAPTVPATEPPQAPTAVPTEPPQLPTVVATEPVQLPTVQPPDAPILTTSDPAFQP